MDTCLGLYTSTGSRSQEQAVISNNMPCSHTERYPIDSGLSLTRILLYTEACVNCGAIFVDPEQLNDLIEDDKQDDGDSERPVQG